jgi:alkaline phosphatase D
LNRRHFLSTLSSMLVWQNLRALQLDAQTRTQFTTDPFQLGVASGDPAADGVVLWTRLVSDVAAPDLGVPPHAVDVRWEVAKDRGMRQIVKAGRTAATPELGHSVHVEVNGLEAGREYFYRFHVDDATSPVGHTKTAPAFETFADRVRFAFASCQNYEQGYFLTHRDMAATDLDVVVFLGDYIYERHPKLAPGAKPWPRRHSIDTVMTLDEYRRHYAQYKSDPDLRACHQAHAWIVTPDDHEVENDWAGDHSVSEDEQSLIKRRIAAYQAYYENMPLRSLCVPHGSHMQLYRSIPYSKLVQFTVLDTRQFRTSQPCNDDKTILNCEARFDPRATMMGATQEEWFAKTLSASPAQWNIVANQVMISQLAQPVQNGFEFGTDKWDGYVAARKRLTDYLGSAKPRNPVFITGDIHQTWVSDIKSNFDRPESEIVASEIIGTSLTSKGDGSTHMKNAKQICAANPHIRYDNDHRGYFLCEVTRKQIKSDLRIAPVVSRPEGDMQNAASFSVESDRKGIRQTS